VTVKDPAKLGVGQAAYRSVPVPTVKGRMHADVAGAIRVAHCLSDE